MGSLKTSQAGFTMVELLIGLTICAVLVIGITSASSNARKSANFNFSQNTNILKTKQALNKIVSELRYATEMTTPNNTSDIGVPKQTVDFKLNGLRRVIARGGNTGNSIVISYYDIDGNLSESLTLANSCAEALTFTRNATNSLDIAVDIKDNARSDNPIMNSVTTVRMMNLDQ